MIAQRPGATLGYLTRWVEAASLLEMRAIVAAVAEPRLLQEEAVADAAIDLHEKVLRRFTAAKDRRSDAFRALRKGLAYSISVVACARPEAGFDMLRRLTEAQDRDSVWIARQNLRKNRLLRRFPSEVASVLRLLE